MQATKIGSFTKRVLHVYWSLQNLSNKPASKSVERRALYVPYNYGISITSTHALHVVSISHAGHLIKEHTCSAQHFNCSTVVITGHGAVSCPYGSR